MQDAPSTSRRPGFGLGGGSVDPTPVGASDRTSNETPAAVGSPPNSPPSEDVDPAQEIREWLDDPESQHESYCWQWPRRRHLHPDAECHCNLGRAVRALRAVMELVVVSSAAAERAMVRAIHAELIGGEG